MAGPEAREGVMRWMIERLPHVVEPPTLYEAIGVARDGRLIGGCLYTEYRRHPDGGSIEMGAVGHAWLSRRVIATMFGYPFRQLGCHRVTSITPRSNRVARAFLEKLGFKLEGTIRQGFGLRTPACIYGMLRPECRWLMEG